MTLATIIETLYTHILAAPSTVHDFCKASANEMTMTTTPKITHIRAGNLVR